MIFFIALCMQGCPTIFPMEHVLKLLEHRGLKPKASLSREAPKGGGRGRGSPPPAGVGLGDLPREIFGKLHQNGAFWCILE